MGIIKKSRDKGRNNRVHERTPYSGYIFFSTKNGFFEGELENYSTNGLFIKTDEDLTLGDFITVAPPYMEDKLIKFQAQIRWRNRNGYGVKFLQKRSDTTRRKSKQIIPPKSKQINKGTTKESSEKRFVPRTPYSGPVFFATKRGLFEGVLKNYSKYGLFIKTHEDLAVAEFITVALPQGENKVTKLKGQIIWRNREGYGVELIIKRDDTDHQHRKILAKS